MNFKILKHFVRTKKLLRPWEVLNLDTLTSICSSGFVVLLTYILPLEYHLSGFNILIWLLGSLIASLISFYVFGIYKLVIRYSTLREIGHIFTTCFGKDILLWSIMVSFSSLSYKNSLLLGMTIIDLVITICALSLSRVIMIKIYDHIAANNKAGDNLQRIFVYGTNDKTASAISRLRNSSHYLVKGLITYGVKKRSCQMAGLDICYFRNAEDLIKDAKKYSVSGILFPYIGDAQTEQSRLIKFCHSAKLKTYVLPSVDEMTDDVPLHNYIRKVKLEDLLGRDEIKISMDEIIENFNNKIIMVTGAAGSIGSELCRQLATFGVKQLILFDNAETPLHNIRLELEDKFPELNFVPVIGDVRSLPRLDYVFKKYHPQVVFHAAAYKHVPLMEENPCEAVWVNVCGSRQVADKCVEYGVEKMVMISTDKAVNPTNIMGCTKRLAEIYVQSLGLAIEHGEIQGKTKFVTTRFGNVLGSNGSVIPRFRDQIEHGGPVTVTHPEINRFFMTIPEACRLVMEAATFSTGTQIFIFDMGTPVKIVTLAERMIQLAGLEVGRDIKIEFTGLRPGEKLYEEVLATKENTIPTTHERIFVAKAREYPYPDACGVMTKLTEFATIVEIPDMVRLMKSTVPEFKSKNSEYEKYDVSNN